MTFVLEVENAYAKVKDIEGDAGTNLCGNYRVRVCLDRRARIRRV
jgi:hypothetical protein